MYREHVGDPAGQPVVGLTVVDHHGPRRAVAAPVGSRPAAQRVGDVPSLLLPVANRGRAPDGSNPADLVGVLGAPLARARVAPRLEPVALAGGVEWGARHHPQDVVGVLADAERFDEGERPPEVARRLARESAHDADARLDAGPSGCLDRSPDAIDVFALALEAGVVQRPRILALADGPQDSRYGRLDTEHDADETGSAHQAQQVGLDAIDAGLAHEPHAQSALEDPFADAPRASCGESEGVIVDRDVSTGAHASFARASERGEVVEDPLD